MHVTLYIHITLQGEQRSSTPRAAPRALWAIRLTSLDTHYSIKYLVIFYTIRKTKVAWT